MRSSRVCRTTSAGVRGLDLKRPFILAPSSAAASAAAAAEAEEASGGARGGEGRGEAAGLLRPPDPKEKQPRNSATGPAAAKPSPHWENEYPPLLLLPHRDGPRRRGEGSWGSGSREIVTRCARARGGGAAVAVGGGRDPPLLLPYPPTHRRGRRQA